MDLRRTKMRVSFLPHINDKIKELPEAIQHQMTDPNCSLVHIAAEMVDDSVRGRNKRKIEDDKTGTFSGLETTVEQIKKRKNQHMGDSTPQLKKSLPSSVKQTSEEEKDGLNCMNAPIRNDEIKSNDSQADSILDNVDLNRLFREEGKTSPKLNDECRTICKFIESKSEHIAHVEAAYKDEKDKKVIFLVFAEVEIENPSNRESEIRLINKYSDESRFVLHCKENNPLTEKDSRQIGVIIDKYSQQLMRDHKFLSAISASSVVSKHFGTEKHVIEERPCIVLTVLVKGVIPLDEEPFPTELDGIPVDVREGGVSLCGQKAESYQTNVKMGCKIASSIAGTSGTLGGFVEHPEYGLCGITCAHVVMDKDSLQELKTKQKLTEKNFKMPMIYQPGIPKPNEGEQGPDYEVGKVVIAIYKVGENDKPGVDLALFKIEKRAPTNGGFPDTQLPSFKAGLVWGKPGIPSSNKDVQKFGQVTGNTQGEYRFDKCVFKDISFLGKLKHDETKTPTLNNQYYIKSSDDKSGFCQKGDSGALVFMKDNTGGEPDLRCIGMVVAKFDPDNSGLVTPITAILDELKVQQLKSFIINEKFDQINNELRTHVEKIYKLINENAERINKNDKRFCEVDHKSGC